MPKPKKKITEEEEVEEIETPVEDIKNEKATDDKTPTDIANDTGEPKGIKRLEDLNGLGPQTAQKLRDLGISGVVGLATERPDEIAAMMKVSYSIAKGWCSQAQEAVMAKMTMQTAEEVDEEKKKKIFRIKTGSSQFNDLLGGGISTWSITGLAGRFESGKTQICFDAVVDVLANLWICPDCHINLKESSKCPDCGKDAVKAKAVFIETEPDTFHLDRLKQIATGRGLINKINWKNLLVCGAKQVPTAKAQFLQYKIVQKACEKGEPIVLVIVDSFNSKFRAGYSRSEMLPIRTREFAEHFNIMEYLACTYNIAWLLTLQCIAPPRPDQGLQAKMKFGDQFYPVGGDLVLHDVNTWIGLQQVKTELWKAVLFDSSYLPRGSADFILTAKGLMNGIA